ncbi:putative hydrolase of the HAD superfamily [Amycolatopsis arida]|uniref:Putative hydrolase of the HAD superfamily n=1 Tax=Amycolatopsis arida TaxID=587909 RepID=A0A1I5T1Z3_9PSEU|nr:HAD family phosphatase [Amycolatopsis arida]TDX96267.1 putative hydrolase of the HAD superfamily [Amycolatopsis arida]SFP76861.1 putative hydrolase of the HAD superfamily [Amycolatopsis arida]
MTGNGWLVFDYGEVICGPTTALPDLAARLGAPLPDVERAYWARRNAYDRGMDDLVYWRAIGDAVGVTVDPATAAELTELDVAGWSHTDPDTLDLLDELAGAGRRLALLSNAPVSFARFAERQDWARHFRELVFSADVGLAKPDRAIFDLLVDRIGAAAPDCLFLDDRPENVAGARTAGLRAERWPGAASARALVGLN